MSPHPDLELVCSDMAGTTVADDGAVVAAFRAAFDDLQVADTERPALDEYVEKTMGESKITVFRALFHEEERAQQANRAFERSYEAAIERGEIQPIEGAGDAIRTLREAGLKVALLTGFSVPTRDLLVAKLGWQDVADVLIAPSEAGRGRPHPDLVLAAILRTGADDVAAVAVVGDTNYDMVTGGRAGASRRIGVLTGMHDEAQLREGGATDVLPSVRELPALLLGAVAAH